MMMSKSRISVVQRKCWQQLEHFGRSSALPLVSQAHALGGLPLAITQISGFIVQQKLSLQGSQAPYLFINEVLRGFTKEVLLDIRMGIFSAPFGP
jgi:hypothetical protein